jgi:ABC-type transport system involved in multi-copper enzyme maturation permease subunit
MTGRVTAVAAATFREAVRDKVLLVVVLFAAGMVLFSRVLGWLSVEDELKMVQDFSLSGMSLLSLFLCMLVGASSLAREVERRTVYTVLSRTVRRSEFIVGKFVGLVGVFWLCLIGAAALVAVWVLLWGGQVGEALGAAVAGLLLEVVVLTSVALFLGALAAPAIAAVGTCAFYLVGHSTEALRELTRDGRSEEFASTFAVLYRILPNLENLNFINHTTSGRPVEWMDLALGAVHAGLWTTAFLVGTIALFRRRQF